MTKINMNLVIKCPKCEVVFSSSDELLKHFRKCYPYPQKLPCIRCKITCRDRHGWKKHWATHFPDRNHHCDDCKGAFKTKGELTTHRKVLCNGKYNCDQCDFVEKSGKEMTQHKKMHQFKNPHKCAYCIKVFGNLQRYRRHIGQYHSKEWESSKMKGNKETKTTNPRKCEKCGVVIFNYYRKHVRYCEGGFKCPTCQQSFPHRDQLSMHIETHATDKILPCSVCSKKFGTEKALNIHERNVHRSKKDAEQNGKTNGSSDDQPRKPNEKTPCSKCGRLFRKANISIHERECQGTLRCKQCKLIDVVHNRCRRFCCKKCRKCYFTFSDLIKHVIDTHKIKRHQVSLPRYWEEIKGPRVLRRCPKCQRVFRGDRYFNSRFSKHLQVCKKKHQCWICKKVFKTSWTVRQHIKRVHLGKRNHKCKDCGRSFWVPSQLKRHEMFYHILKDDLKGRMEVYKKTTDRYDLTCKVCGRRFWRNGNRQIHERSCKELLHCKECNKTFNKRQTYDIHMRRHKKEKPFQCTRCTKSFITNDDLRKHQQRVHNDFSAWENTRQPSKETYPPPIQGVPGKRKLEERIMLENVFFPCPFCGFRSKQSETTRNHVNDKHKDKNVTRKGISTFQAINGQRPLPMKKLAHVCFMCGEWCYDICVLRYHAKFLCK